MSNATKEYPNKTVVHDRALTETEFIPPPAPFAAGPVPPAVPPEEQRRYLREIGLYPKGRP